MFDTFVEELITVHTTGKILLAKIGVVLAVIVLTIAVFWFIPAILPLMFSIFVVGAYFAIKFLNVEYEYAFTNGELDVDKILGKRKRKRMVSTDSKSIKLMAPYTADYESDATAYSVEYTYDFSSSPSAAGRWFVIFEDKDGKLCFMVMQPSEKLRTAMKSYLRQKMKGA